MIVLRKPGVVAASMFLALALGCGTGDGGGKGTDRTGPGAAPSSGVSGNSAAPGAGAAGSDTSGFNNGTGVMPIVGGMKFSDAGFNETTSPDDVKCGGAKFTPKIDMTLIPGNILLVADKSGSMMQNFAATGTQKGEEARKAIANAITGLMDQVKVGVVFFPDVTGCAGQDCSCNVPPFASAPPQIPFTPGTMFVPTWNSSYFPVDNGNTPLSEGLQAADKALTDNLPTLTGITIVVVVTDGAPNCVLRDMAVNDKVATLTPLPARWLGMGVKTYVIGLPGAMDPFAGGAILDPEAEQILNAVAAAGGTDKYIPATDPMTVQTELAKIIQTSVSSNFETCMIPLEKQPPNLDDVNLVVTMNGMELAVDRDLGDAGGWALDADAKNIVLQGRFCELAKMGEYQNITVVFGCVDVPPLPPPPPPI